MLLNIYLASDILSMSQIFLGLLILGLLLILGRLFLASIGELYWQPILRSRLYMSPGQWAEEDQVRVYLGCSQEDRVVSNIQVLQFVESLHHQQQKERVEDSQDWDIHHRPDSGVGQQALP